MRFGFCLWFVVNILTITVSVLGQSAGPNWENVALQKPCSMSSRYTGIFPNNDCSYANNGNTGTTYNDGNCIHTADNDKHPDWSVDLGHNYTIRRITIYIRGSSGFRMTSVMVWVDTSLVFTFPSSASNILERTDIQTNTLPRKGKRVKLTRTSSPESDNGNILLNFCEVQVWACTAGYFGEACNPCRPECASSLCDDLQFPNTCPESNPCNYNPCQNGGTCQHKRIVSEERYTCLCQKGYMGDNCENDINECSGVSCANGGTCINQIGSYICACSQGYTGRHCENATVPGADRSDANLTGPVVGAVMGAGALIAASIVLVCCWWRRQKGKAGERNGEQRTPQEGTMQFSTVSSSLDPPSASVGTAKAGVETGPDVNYESLRFYANGVTGYDASGSI